MKKETITFQVGVKTQSFVIYSTLHKFGHNIFELFNIWQEPRKRFRINEFIKYCRKVCPQAHVFPHGGVSELEKQLRGAINTDR